MMARPHAGGAAEKLAAIGAEYAQVMAAFQTLRKV
jgi:hypothetical protein